MKEPVCIVLVNFKGHLDTIECLESVLKSTYREFQIVVVDNSPGNDSLTEIVKWAEGKNGVIRTKLPEYVEPQVQKPVGFRLLSEGDPANYPSLIQEKLILIKARHNNGFAAGNNVAIRAVLKSDSVKFIWLLNNDTVIEPVTLGNLVVFASRSHAGMIGTKLLYYSNPTVIQALGGRYNPWFGRIKEIGVGLQVDEAPKVFKMDYVIGASMFLKRECIEEVGLMNESLFLYFEELDWAIRARRKRWLLDYCPVNVYHKVGGSTNRGREDNSAIADFYYARNRVLIALLHYPWTLLTLYSSFIVFIFNRMKRKQFDRIWMLLKILINPRRGFDRRQ